MIHGQIHLDKQQFYYPKAIQKALEFLGAHDFSTWEPGSYEIDGRKMYANVDVVMTKAYEEAKVEGHKDYMDVQYVVYGDEIMAWHNDGHEEPIEAYPDKDVYFYNPKLTDNGQVYMHSGDYAIFYPTELHRTLIAPGEVQEIRKVIVKIHKSLLAE